MIFKLKQGRQKIVGSKAEFYEQERIFSKRNISIRRNDIELSKIILKKEEN